MKCIVFKQIFILNFLNFSMDIVEWRGQRLKNVAEHDRIT